MLAALFLCGACAEPEPGVRVVLITLDTLRLDSFTGVAGENGTADGGVTTMPELERWAQGGEIFDRCFSATSTTQPSHASMLTGLHPWQHGVTRNGQRLAAELVTVPEKLQEAGFATAAVVASFPLASTFAFDQGFEHFDDRFELGKPGSQWRQDAETAGPHTDDESDNETEDEHEEEDPEEQAPDRFYNLANEITDRALALLDDTTASQQFFWFHYFDAHSPYGDTGDGETVTPSRILSRAEEGEPVAPAVAEARALYDLDVRFMDRQLGRLLERLEADSERYQTHVVVVADHGESFGEDGSLAHGRRLIPSQIHVPCIVRSPLLGPGHRTEVVGSVDIAATLAALAGVEAPEIGGRNLLAPPDRPARAFGMRRTYREPYRDRRLDGSMVLLDHNLFYLVDRDGKIYRGNSGMLMPPAPGAELPEEFQRQLTQLFSTFEEQLAGRSTEELLDDETRDALRSLGYVG